MSDVDYYEKVRQKMSKGIIKTPKHKKVLEFLKIIWTEEEAKLLSNFENNLKKGCYIVLDDIRVWTMIKTWREITLPKLDITSFGHWSGTGIVEC